MASELVGELTAKVTGFTFAGHSLGGTSAFCLCSKVQGSKAVCFNPGAAPTNPVLSGPGPGRARVYHIFGDIISTHMSGVAAEVLRIKIQGVIFGSAAAHSSEQLKGGKSWSYETAYDENQAFNKWRRGLVNIFSTLTNYASYVGLGIKNTIYPIPGGEEKPEATVLGMARPY